MSHFQSAKKNFLNCLQLKCSMLLPSTYANSTCFHIVFPMNLGQSIFFVRQSYGFMKAGGSFCLPASATFELQSLASANLLDASSTNPTGCEPNQNTPVAAQCTIPRLDLQLARLFNLMPTSVAMDDSVREEGRSC